MNMYLGDEVLKYTHPINFILEQQEMERIKAAFAPLSREFPRDKRVEFNFTKKEEPVSTFNLVMSAEKLAVYLQDLQEMAPGTKTEYDKNGNTIYNPETNEYRKVEIPLEDRWVSPGEMRVNAEGKFVVKSSSSILAEMEALNAQRARIADYQA